MGGFYKRAETGLLVILILVIAVFFFGWIINVSQRECRSNRDCGSEAYCGSDFSCHNYPTIQKTVVQYNLFWPAVIIGMAIVVVAVIFKWDRVRKEKIAEEQKIIAKTPKEEPEEAIEPYYKGVNNIKTP